MATFGTSGRTSCKREPRVKCHWTPKEDELLTNLVQIHGPAKWDKIATRIHGRTGKSCRIRWLNQLNPGVDKTPFSPEEKRRLVLLHREFGNRWSTIVYYFPGRTNNQVKNQYHILAGTRYNNRAAGSSSCNDPHMNNGSTCLSQNQNISVFLLVHSFLMLLVEELFGAMSSSVEQRRPSFVAGFSSVYGNSDGPTHVGAPSSIMSGLGPHPHENPRYESFMTLDANSDGIQGHQFMDFLGVGSS